MKFKLLSVGQKFKFEDEIYVKTSPLIANNIKTGHNKMIPRYATLTLLDEAGTSEAQTVKESLNAEEVFNAFNNFYEQCIGALEKNEVLVPVIKDELDKARDEFIKQLQ